jgi:hypothetical protein
MILTEAWVQEKEVGNMELKRHVIRDYLSNCMALQASVAQDIQFSGVCESCFVDIW